MSPTIASESVRFSEARSASCIDPPAPDTPALTFFRPDMLRIAAAIVHYGRLDATLACVKALRQSTYEVEVFVVDNAGDGRPGAVADSAPPIRWVEPGENLGYGRALNLIASHALHLDRRGALLCLNNDALVTPEAILHLAQALEAEPGRAVAVPRIVLSDGSERLWYGGGEIEWHRGSARVAGAGGSSEAAEALRPRDVGFATGCALLARLEALADVGGFDARYFLYEEDVELSIRLRAAGWSLRYVPQAVVHHVGQGSQRADGEPFVPIHRPEHPRAERLTELQVCNRLLTVSRHARSAQRLAFALYSPLYWAVRSLLASLRGKPGLMAAVWRGFARYRRLRRQPPGTEVAAKPLALADRISADGGHLPTRTTWSPS